MKSLWLVLFLTLGWGLVGGGGVRAQEEVLEGKVVGIIREDWVTPTGGVEGQLYQKLEVLVVKGLFTGKKVEIENGNVPTSNLQKYRVGDRVVVNYAKDIEGNDWFAITDYVRRGEMGWLLLIFVVLAVVVAGKKGVMSLLSMVISFLIIFRLILPRILAGSDPAAAAITGSLLIIPVTFFMSHGVNKKTVIAILGTLVALVVTGIMATFFVEVTKLSGFAAEEAGFLQSYREGAINMKSLLLAGIIIGVLGVLDDVTISQAAIVEELRAANSQLGWRELYLRAMAVGKDHIASMVNTLILVYAGAATPLLLLFVNNPRPLLEVINYEIVADEVVRTLVGSVGLILAVPITTAIAAAGATKRLDLPPTRIES